MILSSEMKHWMTSFPHFRKIFQMKISSRYLVHFPSVLRMRIALCVLEYLLCKKTLEDFLQREIFQRYSKLIIQKIFESEFQKTVGSLQPSRKDIYDKNFKVEVPATDEKKNFNGEFFEAFPTTSLHR